MTRNGSTPPAIAPITDVSAWIAQQGSLRREVMTCLGELLLGVTAVESTREAESEVAFTTKALGVPTMYGRTVVEDREMSSVSAVTTAMALAEWINAHEAAVGPGRHTDPPMWTTTTIAGETYRHPLQLRAAFSSGSIAEVPVVIAIDARPSMGRPNVTAAVRPEHQSAAIAALDALDEAATALNPFRGRICRATSAGAGLTLTVIEPPETLSRATLVQPPEVFEELDLCITAVSDRHEQLRALGSQRRGVMLSGKPGTGKSQLSLLIAKELVTEAGFTAFILDASAGERLLTAVVEEAARLQPALVVVEDCDLFVRQRSAMGGGGALAELLGAMDIRQNARILTVASTNDVSTLDPAAVRTGRFSSHIEIRPPTREAAAQILDQLLARLPGGGAGVDTEAVAASLPAGCVGSDIVEIATRTVLASPDGAVTTEALVAEAAAGRWHVELLDGGAYL